TRRPCEWSPRSVIRPTALGRLLLFFVDIAQNLRDGRRHRRRRGRRGVPLALERVQTLLPAVLRGELGGDRRRGGAPARAALVEHRGGARAARALEAADGGHRLRGLRRLALNAAQHLDVAAQLRRGLRARVLVAALVF